MYAIMYMVFFISVTLTLWIDSGWMAGIAGITVIDIAWDRGRVAVAIIGLGVGMARIDARKDTLIKRIDMTGSTGRPSAKVRTRVYGEEISVVRDVILYDAVWVATVAYGTDIAVLRHAKVHRVHSCLKVADKASVNRFVHRIGVALRAFSPDSVVVARINGEEAVDVVLRVILRRTRSVTTVTNTAYITVLGHTQMHPVGCGLVVARKAVILSAVSRNGVASRALGPGGSVRP
jgi:hypothetical protein